MTRTRYGIVQVGGMSESAYSIRTIELIKQEKMGNYTVLFAGAWSNIEIERVAQFCARCGYRFVVDEFINRLDGSLRSRYRTFDFSHLAQLAKKYQKNYSGTLLMCEYGGLTLYWPESSVTGSPMCIMETCDAGDAEKDMVTKLRRIIEQSKQVGLPRPYISIEASGLVADQLYKAGIDRVDYEMTFDPDTELFYSAVKSAAICRGRKNFGVDIAMVWYGGNQHDKLWFKRWRISLLHAFIRGADPIYAEHGLMNYHALGKRFEADHPHVVKFRRVLSEFARFVARHPRAPLPDASLAVCKGNLDSFSGLGQLFRWGQRGNEQMRKGDAENSWDLFKSFYRRNTWEFRYKNGEHDYSGNPPNGQIDVISATAATNALRRYKGLFFLGTHIMTEDIYRNLINYVRSGGELILCVAHLNCNTQIGSFSLFRNGDVAELCGVQLNMEHTTYLPQGIKFVASLPGKDFCTPLWGADCDPKYANGPFRMAELHLTSAKKLAVASDRFADKEFHDWMLPVVTLNELGKGRVILVNSVDFPGHLSLKQFYGDLLHFWAERFRKNFTVECSDRVRYALYREDDLQVLYLLNTEENLISEVILAKRIRISLPPAEIRVVYQKKDIIVIPTSPFDRVRAVSIGTDRKITCNLLRKPVGVINAYRNGKAIECTLLIG